VTPLLPESHPSHRMAWSLFGACAILNAARLRSETDLESMSADLLEVVDDTVQPEHVTVWLRSGTQR